MSLFKEILAEAGKKEKAEKIAAAPAPEDVKKSDEDMEAAIENWKRLLKVKALLEKALEPVKAEISSIEEFFTPIARDSYKNIKKVNESIVEYKDRSTTSVKYQQVVQKALEIANDAHRKVLEAKIEEVTTRGVSESVKLLDPEIDGYLKELKTYINGDDVLEKLGDLEKLPRNIINKKKRDGLLGESKLNEAKLPSVKKIVADIGRMLKLGLSKIKKKLDNFTNATDNFAKAVKSEV